MCEPYTAHRDTVGSATNDSFASLGMSELWGHGGVSPDLRGGFGGSGNVRQRKTF